jgi:hypothetical protein
MNAAVSGTDILQDSPAVHHSDSATTRDWPHRRVSVACCRVLQRRQRSCYNPAMISSVEGNVKRQSVILLGASNLTIGWRPLLRALRQTIRQPLSLYVALGMGRSYVDWSGFWLRRLPSIVDCGLWDALPPVPRASADCRPPLVLVTDIGNDIVYGVQPERIARQTAICLERIRSRWPHARVVMTALPMASVRTVGRVRYQIARTTLFPTCFLSLPTVLHRAEQLEVHVHRLATEFHCKLVVPDGAWYGHDPIHVLRHLRQDVFREMFRRWDLPELPHAGLAQLPVPPDVPLPVAALRTLAWIPVRATQPAWESPELTVSAW